jgi:polyhydroxyalkanoate synthesis repressor PhaR
MSKARNGKDEVTVIKKYANRRLYDTGRSSYVTLDDLCEMVKEGHDFVVQDAKTGEDLTRGVLTQIIVDQESKDGQQMLPTNFLRTLIGFYGDKMQGMVPGYLEQTMNMFSQNQERMKEQFAKSFEGMGVGGNMFKAPANLEELTRQNMEMFERTMKMMAPFGMKYGAGNEKDSKE